MCNKKPFSLTLISLALVSFTTAALSALNPTITGTVYQSVCPPNPAMGMPCSASPVPGCTVTVSLAIPTIMIYPPPPLPAGATTTVVTDANGIYRARLDTTGIPVGTTVSIAACKQDVGCGYSSAVLSRAAVETADVYISEAVDPLPPSEVLGFATLSGKVLVEDGSPVAGASVSVYPLSGPVVYGGIATGDLPVHSDPVSGGGSSEPYPGIGYPALTAITDAAGAYSIKDIPVYGDPTIQTFAVQGAYFSVSAYKDGVGSTETQTELRVGSTKILDLTLQAFPPPPQPLGTGTLRGTVWKASSVSGAITKDLLAPVAGCTVMVCGAYAPVMETTVRSPAIFDNVYTVVTDVKGNFLIPGIDMWSPEYVMTVMGQKDGLFGSAQVTLLLGDTVNSRLLLESSPIAYTDPATGDPVMTPAAEYYAEELRKKSPVRRPGNAVVRRDAPNALVVNGTMEFTVPLSQRVVVVAVSLDGKVIARLHDGVLRAGEARVGLSRIPEGSRVIVRIAGETFSSSVRVAQ